MDRQIRFQWNRFLFSHEMIQFSKVIFQLFFQKKGLSVSLKQMAICQTNQTKKTRSSSNLFIPVPWFWCWSHKILTDLLSHSLLAPRRQTLRFCQNFYYIYRKLVSIDHALFADIQGNIFSCFAIFSCQVFFPRPFIALFSFLFSFFLVLPSGFCNRGCCSFVAMPSLFFGFQPGVWEDRSLTRKWKCHIAMLLYKNTQARPSRRG